MDILVKVAPRTQWESLVWVRNCLAVGKTKLAVYVNRHGLWYFSVSITRKLTASQPTPECDSWPMCHPPPNLFSMLLVLDKSSYDSLSSAIEKCQAWVLISKSCCSNDEEEKKWGQTKEVTVCGAQGFSISLKSVLRLNKRYDECPLPFHYVRGHKLLLRPL